MTFVDPPRVVQAPPILSDRDIHCWYVPLRLPASDLGTLYAALTPAEAARSTHYRFAVRRPRFVVRHAALRMILITYSGIPPQVLRFCVNRYGKPELDVTLLKHPLAFNLSHSEDLAVVAVRRMAQLGV